MEGRHGLAELVEGRLAQELAELGFARRGSSFVVRHPEVTWLLAAEPAPWSTEERAVFSVAWAVEVPGLRQVLGDQAPPGPPVRGWLGQTRAAREPCWFRLSGTTVPLLGPLRLARVAGEVARRVETDAVPQLCHFPDARAVQRHLAAGLDQRLTAPAPAEVAAIRRIAAISVLHGDLGNAARWLDHLEARSARVTSPDLVAERLAPLRRRCLAS